MDNNLGCGDSSCIVQRASGMVTNGGCRCPVVGSRNPSVTQEDRLRLRTAFQELNKEVKRLKAEALVKESIHKQKVTRMETALYNILANSKASPQSSNDKVNQEIAIRGLSEPSGVAAIVGMLKED